jgi:hypothetical protein
MSIAAGAPFRYRAEPSTFLLRPNVAWQAEANWGDGSSAKIARANCMAPDTLSGRGSTLTLAVSQPSSVQDLKGAPYRSAARPPRREASPRLLRRPISEILPVDAEVADKAADLRSRRKSLRMPDALILTTADLHPESKPHRDRRPEGGQDRWIELQGKAAPTTLTPRRSSCPVFRPLLASSPPNGGIRSYSTPRGPQRRSLSWSLS